MMKRSLWSCILAVFSAWPLLAQPGQTTRVQENDPSVIYTGNWYTNHESPNIGGQAFLTNAKGATAALSFTRAI